MFFFWKSNQLITVCVFFRIVSGFGKNWNLNYQIQFHELSHLNKVESEQSWKCTFSTLNITLNGMTKPTSQMSLWIIYVLAGTYDGKMHGIDLKLNIVL